MDDNILKMFEKIKDELTKLNVKVAKLEAKSENNNNWIGWFIIGAGVLAQWAVLLVSGTVKL